MAESWTKLKSVNVFLSFNMRSIQNRSALVCELLRNNSLSVGQLYKDKSLVLLASNLIFFSTDLKNSEFLLNNLLLELIYFLILFLR